MIVLDSATKGKITSTRTIALKLGQKESVKVPAIELEFDVPNDKLNQVMVGLKELLFSDKPSTEPKAVKARQARLESVDPVSDRVSLSTAGTKLGTFTWDDEQTGCAFTIVRGTARANSNIVLEGMTAKKWRFKAQEGGTVKVKVALLSTRAEELDDATHGRVMKLQKGNVEFMLVPPAIDTAQQTIDDEDDEQLGERKDATQTFIATHGNKGDRPGVSAH